MIPDFQSIMRPLLDMVKDEQEHSISDLINQLAIFFSLSEKEQSELLPSGRQPTFNNRVHWAKLYLHHAQLLKSTG